jgi:cell shape-determining protein MreC
VLNLSAIFVTVTLRQLFIVGGCVLAVGTVLWMVKHFVDKRFYYRYARQNMKDENARLQAENEFLQKKAAELEEQNELYRCKEARVMAVLNMEE